MKNSNLLQAILGFSLPALSSLALLLLDLNFILLPADKVEILNLEVIHAWKTIGVLLPAFWLTAIGANGLLKDGGFLIRILKISGIKIQPSENSIFLFAVLWLLIGAVFAFLLQILVLKDFEFASKWAFYRSSCYLLYAIHTFCLSSGLGVFGLLASNNFTKKQEGSSPP